MEYLAVIGAIYLVGKKYQQHSQQQSSYAPDSNKRFMVNDYIRDDIQNDLTLFHVDNVNAGDIKWQGAILGDYENAVGHVDEMREPYSAIMGNMGSPAFTVFGDANYTPDAVLTQPAFYEWKCTNLTQYN